MVCIGVMMSVLSFLFYLFSPVALSLYIKFLVWAIFIFYSLLSDIFGNGRSWGKRATGLKVIKIDGTEARVSDYVGRWMFRPLDIYLTLGTLGIFLISSTTRSQRLGDIVANTVVIRIKPPVKVVLSQIENLRSVENYKVIYHQVSKMSEKEMMMIRTILDEVKIFPNERHRALLEELANNLSERLSVQRREKDPGVFLQVLINDFVALTR
jgi:uncharacterized RDD family membrane protein YckC